MTGIAAETAGTKIWSKNKYKMARLNPALDSDDDLPELSTILRPSKFAAEKVVHSPTSNTTQDRNESSPRKKCFNRQVSGNLTKESNVAELSSKQIPLRSLQPTQINSLSLPISSNLNGYETKTLASGKSVRISPRKSAKKQVDYSKVAQKRSDSELSFLGSDESFTDLSGFIVPDSASDEDLLPRRSHKTEPGQKSRNKSRNEPSRKDSVDLTQSPFYRGEDTGPNDLISPKKTEKTSKFICPESPLRFRTPPRLSVPSAAGSDLDDPFSKMRLNPTKSVPPSKLQDIPRPITPPSSPSKTKLHTLFKRNRVPPSPHRPSIDAFWSADVIIDWNEEYSPIKTLPSPRKNRIDLVGEDDDELSPSESPRKRSPNKSPAKRDKNVIEQRKAFDEKKHNLATLFLAEVDRAVGDGRVAMLAESTGGIKVVWSKKLSSTAGRANWRREAIRSKNADGSISVTTHRHHATIELAAKVIDDEDRLTNVIAHEYCHLANFMISGIKDHPHGAAFKSWAAKTTRAFKHRGVNVTTKHTYEIAYKYIWICPSEMCGLEYKRHSKSIDPAKHSCGSCKGKLVQVKPVPRKGDGEGKRSDYQDFVKREHERVRTQNPGKGFGEIMGILGREFRESKKPAVAVTVVEERSDSNVIVKASGRPNLDDVARKLNFLNLKA